MKYNLIALSISLFLLNSCATVYVPQTMVPREFTKAHDISGSVTVGLSGINYDLAYSPINHFYVFGGGNRVESYLFREGATSESFYLGIGYYTNIGTKDIEVEFGYKEAKFDVDFGQSPKGEFFYSGDYSSFFGSFLFRALESKSRKTGLAMKINLDTYYFDAYNMPGSGYRNPFGDYSQNFYNQLRVNISAFYVGRITNRVSFFGNLGANLTLFRTYSFPITFRIGLKFNLRKSVME